MNRILLTSRSNRQAAARRMAATIGMTAAGPSRANARPQKSRFDAYALPRDRGGLSTVQDKRALTTSPMRERQRQGYLRWAAPGGGVETALFVSVQAVMLLCVLRVAVELLTAA
jgi:hypothetical protein